MISDYLNQSATLKRSGTISVDGSRAYTDVPIVCRFEPKTRQFTSEKGEVVQSQAAIYTITPVKIGDSIVYAGRTWVVQAVFERWGMDSLSHYEVWL